MAEDVTPASGGRQVIIIATVVTVVFFTIFIWTTPCDVVRTTLVIVEEYASNSCLSVSATKFI